MNQAKICAKMKLCESILSNIGLKLLAEGHVFSVTDRRDKVDSCSIWRNFDTIEEVEAYIFGLKDMAESDKVLSLAKKIHYLKEEALTGEKQ